MRCEQARKAQRRTPLPEAPRNFDDPSGPALAARARKSAHATCVARQAPNANQSGEPARPINA
eukprot:13881005-Alexandrium_andersonii.AAC.1